MMTGIAIAWGCIALWYARENAKLRKDFVSQARCNFGNAGMLLALRSNCLIRNERGQVIPYSKASVEVRMKAEGK